jgi:catechol 2,3-dioxygenase-like lactoylglutathione lyase family enzyme
MEFTLSIIALPTQNLRRAFEFYRDGLGLELANPRPDGGMPEPVEFRLNAGSHLMLVPSDGFAFVLGGHAALDASAARLHECVIGIPCATQSELERVFAAATQGGATPVEAPAQQPWGYSATFRDFDGHTFLLSVR